MEILGETDPPNLTTNTQSGLINLIGAKALQVSYLLDESRASLVTTDEQGFFKDLENEIANLITDFNRKEGSQFKIYILTRTSLNQAQEQAYTLD